ncbi:MAG: hypothetical protein HY819_02765 [Acidobacteria bacterium]|nr:hypothetical protein [Acidobacteriota bacterium]
MSTDKALIWQEFANQIDGNFINSSVSDHIQVKVLASHWNIVFDIHSSAGTSGNTLTRVRTIFLSKDNFLFTIYHQDIFSEIAKFFGMQDIEAGFNDFDKTFIVKSNNSKQIIVLLKNDLIREILLKHPYVYFDIRKNESFLSEELPDGVLELYLHIVGIVLDVKELMDFYLLFTETLKQLCIIGSAYERPSRLSL